MSGVLNFWLASCLLCGADGEAKLPESRLNVLLMMVDDLRDSLGCYGNAAVRSPHIDALAARGVLFERATTGPIPRRRRTLWKPTPASPRNCTNG
jgi:hypothetical protein